MNQEEKYVWGIYPGNLQADTGQVGFSTLMELPAQGEREPKGKKEMGLVHEEIVLTEEKLVGCRGLRRKFTADVSDQARQGKGVLEGNWNTGMMLGVDQVKRKVSERNKAAIEKQRCLHIQ